MGESPPCYLAEKPVRGKTNITAELSVPQADSVSYARGKPEEAGERCLTDGSASRGQIGHLDPSTGAREIR